MFSSLTPRFGRSAYEARQCILRTVVVIINVHWMYWQFRVCTINCDRIRPVVVLAICRQFVVTCRQFVVICWQFVVK